MSKIIPSIRELKLRSFEVSRYHREENIKKIYQQLESLESDSTPAAYFDFHYPNRLHLSRERVFSQNIRIGTREISFDSNKTPLSLPLTINLFENNAVVFELEEGAPSPLQQIGFRLLLSVNPGLCHLYLVDANYGCSFTQLSRITHPQLKIKSIDSSTGVENLIKSLESIIVESNRSYKSSYPDLTTYNSKLENTPLPYHVVLIDDFPELFTETTIADLRRIISRHNAVNAGIFIFINHRKSSGTSGSAFRHNLNTQSVIAECALVKMMNDNVRICNKKLPSSFLVRLDGDLNSGIVRPVQALFDEFKVERLNTKVLDSWIEEFKKSDSVWKNNTISGIKVPVGLRNDGKVFDFYMGDDSNSECLDYFALIVGSTGTGKTTFLHTIITQLSMYYSPDEVELYLLDFKHGEGFDRYRHLPHVKAVMSTNSIEFAYRVLLKLSDEAERRSELFREASERTGETIDNIGRFRQITNNNLSRIVLVMDEFQRLFPKNNYDGMVTAARELLTNGIRQWRSAGIIVILSTQTMHGVNIGDAENQISYRFAFRVDAEDSRYLIGNAGASLLGLEKGRCIMHNSTDRSEDKNVEFRYVWSENNRKHIEYLKQKNCKENNVDHAACYVCDSHDADVSENEEIANLSVTKHGFYTYLGKPNILRHTHTRLLYLRKSFANSVFIGQDMPTAINLIALSLIQARKQSPQGSKFYVIDSTMAGDRYENSFASLASLSNDFIVGSIDLLDELSDELNRRNSDIIERRSTNENILVAIFNTQSEISLQAERGPFGMTKSKRAEQLCNLISRGPALGIHFILHSLSYNEIFSNKGLLGDGMWRHFGNKVFFKGADMENIFQYKRQDTINRDNLMVDNNRLDNEEIEYCKIYKKVNKKELIDNLNQI